MRKKDREFVILKELVEREPELFFDSKEERKIFMDEILKKSSFDEKHPNPHEDERRFKKFRDLYIKGINQRIEKFKNRK